MTPERQAKLDELAALSTRTTEQDNLLNSLNGLKVAEQTVVDAETALAANPAPVAETPAEEAAEEAGEVETEPAPTAPANPPTGQEPPAAPAA